MTSIMRGSEPMVFQPSQEWHGNDGNWSTFMVRVGTPEQNFDVLPSAATGQVILPHPIGCLPAKGVPADCPNLRGVLPSNHQVGFMPNISTSWQEAGFYEMLLESKLYVDQAFYGKDRVGLSIQNSGMPTLEGQVIGTVRRTPFFVGFFGLSPIATNFTDFDQPQRAYLTTLRDQNSIPSLSFAYTAGAYYSTSSIRYPYDTLGSI